MRKIERQMIQAIDDRMDWKSPNTEVRVVAELAHIYLHENLIGVWDYDLNQMKISSAGWETTTTKSRLNALLTYVTEAHQVFQRKGQWFIRNEYETIPFEEGFNLIYE